METKHPRLASDRARNRSSKGFIFLGHTPALCTSEAELVWLRLGFSIAQRRPSHLRECCESLVLDDRSTSL